MLGSTHIHIHIHFPRAKRDGRANLGTGSTCSLRGVVYFPFPKWLYRRASRVEMIMKKKNENLDPIVFHMGDPQTPSSHRYPYGEFYRGGWVHKGEGRSGDGETL